MVRLKSALSAVSLTAGVAVVVSIFVVSAGALPTRDKETASEAQYNGRGTISKDTEKGPGPGYYRFYDRWQEEDTPSADALSVRSPSQGSEPTAQAPARALSIMEPPTPYSQVVDNASPRHFFSARGEWKKSNNRLTRYGRNYRYVRPAEDVTPAWFKVRIPTDGFYTVYARWPAAKGNNPKTRFKISTASGVKKVKVNQRRDGGVWMRLGAYKMNQIRALKNLLAICRTVSLRTRANKGKDEGRGPYSTEPRPRYNTGKRLCLRALAAYVPWPSRIDALAEQLDVVLSLSPHYCNLRPVAR